MSIKVQSNKNYYNHHLKLNFHHHKSLRKVALKLHSHSLRCMYMMKVNQYNYNLVLWCISNYIHHHHYCFHHHRAHLYPKSHSHILISIDSVNLNIPNPAQLHINNTHHQLHYYHHHKFPNFLWFRCRIREDTNLVMIQANNSNLIQLYKDLNNHLLKLDCHHHRSLKITNLKFHFHNW